MLPSPLCSPNVAALDLVYARSLKATAYWPQLGLELLVLGPDQPRPRWTLESPQLNSKAAVAEPKTGGLWTQWTIRATLALSAQQWQCSSAVSGELVRPGSRPE